MKTAYPAVSAWVICVATIGTFCAGCNRPASEPNSGTNTVYVGTNEPSSASNTWQNVKQGGTNLLNSAENVATNAWIHTQEASSNAWQKTKEAFRSEFSTNEVSTNYFGYDYSQKNTFVADAKMSLDSFDREAANLSNRLASASDSTKAALQPTLQNIQAKRAELESKYNQIKSATSADWDDTKAAFAKSYHDLKAELKAGWDATTSKLH